MKYIVFDIKDLPTPIIFPEYVQHKTIKCLMPEYYKPLSAGFCQIDTQNKTVSVWGGSVSLDLKSDPDDTYWLTKLIFPE